MPSHRPPNVHQALTHLEQWIRRLNSAEILTLVNTPPTGDLVQLVANIGREIEVERHDAAEDIVALIDPLPTDRPAVWQWGTGPLDLSRLHPDDAAGIRDHLDTDDQAGW